MSITRRYNQSIAAQNHFSAAAVGAQRKPPVVPHDRAALKLGVSGARESI